MKWFVLYVMFSTPAQPEPHLHPQFGPMRTQSMDHCLERRSSLQKYLHAQIKDRRVVFHAFCVELSARGYDEGKAALIRKSGRAM